MHFIIARAELLDLLRTVQDIVAQKNPVPILSNFFLEAKDDRIILTATDLTVGARCSGSAKVIEEGSTTLPARRFAQLIRELTSQHCEISTNDKHMTHVVADSSKFRIPGMAGNEFPTLPDFSDALKISFRQADLKDALYRTQFAVSNEDNRYALTGVFCQVGHDSVTFVGTDSKRMARFCLPLQAPIEKTMDCIIPIKAIGEMIKALNSEDEVCSLHLTPEKIALTANETIIVSKLLTGDYPDVDRIIPEQSNCVVQIHREELMLLLRQMVLFTTDDNQSARFTFTTGELSVLNASNVGEGKVSMPVDYTGDRFDIAFNPASFLDILRHSKNPLISLGFTDSFNPGLIVDGTLEPVHKVLPSQLFVLMPLRLADEA
jgi:DNA polymerase III subunit beta